MNEKVEDLIKLSMKSYESVRIKSTEPTVSSLEQGYLIIDADKKFLFLFTFIKKNMKRKIIVFFSTCKEVEFFSSLLNYVDVPVLSVSVKGVSSLSLTHPPLFNSLGNASKPPPIPLAYQDPFIR